MTATALRTAISADLNSLSVDKLRSVSRYVKSLVPQEKSESKRTATRRAKADHARRIDEELASLESLCGIATITEQDIESDERLAYILRNNR